MTKKINETPQEILAEMKRLCDRLEPGPWHVECIHHDGGDIAYEINQGSQLVAFYENNFDAPANAKSYATFYAQSRTVMPRLIAALEKCMEQRDEYDFLLSSGVYETNKEKDDATIAQILSGEKC